MKSVLPILELENKQLFKNGSRRPCFSHRKCIVDTVFWANEFASTRQRGVPLRSWSSSSLQPSAPRATVILHTYHYNLLKRMLLRCDNSKYTTVLLGAIWLIAHVVGQMEATVINGALSTSDLWRRVLPPHVLTVLSPLWLMRKGRDCAHYEALLAKDWESAVQSAPKSTRMLRE